MRTERWPQEKHPLTHAKRGEVLRKAHNNVFNILARDVQIDLLTDSGTGKMSDKQWADMMRGDESYAGSSSATRTKNTIKELFNIPYVLLVNQGRAAEAVCFNVFLNEPGKHVLGNTPFDTTRHNIEKRGGIVVDCTKTTHVPTLNAEMPEEGEFNFLGDVDMDNFKQQIGNLHNKNQDIAFVIITATCNSNAGQPVSMQNIREVWNIAHDYDIPVFLDLARYAENAYFIKKYEDGYSDVPIASIVREMAQYSDGFLVSGKKDALGNIGGFIGLRNRDTAELVAQEIRGSIGLELVDGAGYGGMSGRDLEALATGIQESVDFEYLDKRVSQVHWLAREISLAGAPVLTPGGHAVFVDAGMFLPHLTWEQFPGHALALALYLEGGIRSVEVGSLMLGRDPDTGENRQAPQELTRLAIPRRLYTDKELACVVETFKSLSEKASSIPAVEIDPDHEYVPRHFAARFLWEGM